MTHSEREFVAQVFAGNVPSAAAGARHAFALPIWFSALAVSALALGAALGFAM